MNWQQQQVSLYSCLADNVGRPAKLRDILFCEFAIPHDWYYKDYTAGQWVSGNSNDLTTIIDMRTGEMPKAEKTRLKQTMQCFTPAGLLRTKKKGQIEEISRSGLMQLDFDKEAIKDYDIEELKRAVFDLPFIAFCALSCSGTGFYALAEIAEPDKLHDYAEHCFEVLENYNVPADTSKGRNVQDLRFVSYDPNMLIREEPKPLRIKRFKAVSVASGKSATTTSNKTVSTDKVINKAVNEILNAQVGNRFPTVQKWAYSLGGMQNDASLDHIKQAIKGASQYTGVEEKYLTVAEECFKDGKANPFNQ